MSNALALMREGVIFFKWILFVFRRIAVRRINVDALVVCRIDFNALFGIDGHLFPALSDYDNRNNRCGCRNDKHTADYSADEACLGAL